MNKKAEKHLARAEGYLERGDEFYAKAADEIIAAKKADTTLSNREVGKWFGKSAGWVGDLVSWRTSERDTVTPWTGPRGAAKEASTARKVLSDPKEAEKVLSDPKVQKAIAESPKASAALMRAAGKVGERMEQTERARYRERNPRHARQHELLGIIQRLSNARTGVVKSFEELQDMVLTPDERGQVMPFAERLETATEMLVAFLSGEGVDFSELLREEA